MELMLNGRVVIDAFVEGVKSYDDYALNNGFFSEAFYEDTGEPLNSDELVQLGEQNKDALWDMAYEVYQSL